MVISRTFRGSSQLLWMVAKRLLTEGKRHVRHVFNSRVTCALPWQFTVSRQFAKNMEDDGDIVRRQIPGDVDVLLK